MGNALSAIWVEIADDGPFKGFRGPVHVREDGHRDGPVLLLIHGFGGSARWFDAVIPLLSDTFRVIRVDLLGHGETGGPAADAPVQALVVAAVLDHAEVSAVTVVGHSFGADVAVELAERSARVQRLIIVAQAPDYSDANLPRGSRVMTVPGLNTALHQIAKSLLPVVAAIRSRTARNTELVARARHDFAALDTAMFRVILVDRRHRMTASPLDEQIRRAGKLALVILGERDHFYGARSAGRYEAAGARVEILPDSGHSPLVEDPERSAMLIREFASEAD